MSEYYTGKISGTIGGKQPLSGTLGRPEAVGGTVTAAKSRPYPVYEGPYEVTPIFEDQRLETKRKSMSDDITVLAIPIYEVSNPQGGVTVTIGGI